MTELFLVIQQFCLFHKTQIGSIPFRKKIGQFFGDQGYISAALAEDLRNSGIILVIKFKKKMKNKLMTMIDKQLLRKRAIVESVIEQLKHISQIEHSRYLKSVVH